jgi:hypothetical protein
MASSTAMMTNAIIISIIVNPAIRFFCKVFISHPIFPFQAVRNGVYEQALCCKRHTVCQIAPVPLGRT